MLPPGHDRVAECATATASHHPKAAELLLQQGKVDQAMSLLWSASWVMEPRLRWCKYTLYEELHTLALKLAFELQRVDNRQQCVTG